MSDEQKKAQEAKPAQEAKETKAAKPKKLSKADQIKQLQSELNESQDKYLRVRAEYDNFRKRSARELIDARTFAKIGAIEEILPVLDHFQMAMAHTNENADFNTLKTGMDMILNEFERCFESLGVERMKTVGEVFDPNLHEAITLEPSDSVAEGSIIREWKGGYKIGDRVLRAPSVVVSSGPAVEEKAEAETADSQS